MVLTFLDEGEKPLTFDHLKGLFHRSPFLGSLMTLSLVTLAGIPPFVGFFAKFYLFKLAFQQGYLFLVILGLITTIFSIFYYMRIVGLLFTQADDKHPVHKTWPAWLVGVAALIAIFGLTIYPESLIAWISGS